MPPSALGLHPHFGLKYVLYNGSVFHRFNAYPVGTLVPEPNPGAPKSPQYNHYDSLWAIFCLTYLVCILDVSNNYSVVFLGVIFIVFTCVCHVPY